MIVKAIFKYLRSTKDFVLTNIEGDWRLDDFTDSDFNQISMIECLSQGLVFVCNGIAVSWKSFKQSITVVSTTEADYLAALDAAKRLFGLGSLLPSWELFFSLIHIFLSFVKQWSHFLGKGTEVSPEIQTHRKALSYYQKTCWQGRCARPKGSFSWQCRWSTN